MIVHWINTPNILVFIIQNNHNLSPCLTVYSLKASSFKAKFSFVLDDILMIKGYCISLVPKTFTANEKNKNLPQVMGQFIRGFCLLHYYSLFLLSIKLQVSLSLLVFLSSRGQAHTRAQTRPRSTDEACQLRGRTEALSTATSFWIPQQLACLPNLYSQRLSGWISPQLLKCRAFTSQS